MHHEVGEEDVGDFTFVHLFELLLELLLDAFATFGGADLRHVAPAEHLDDHVVRLGRLALLELGLLDALDELERRLRARAQDSEEVVNKRMAKAVEEISHWEEYDYVVVNEDLDKAMNHIRRILHAERFKRWRQLDIGAFVGTLCQRSA